MEFITDAVGTAANETIGKHITEFTNWFKELILWENLFKAVGAFFVILLMWIVFKVKNMLKSNKSKEKMRKINDKKDIFKKTS